MSMPKIDLILVSWQRPSMTELVIKTIYRNTERNHYQLIVIDNGSGERQQADLKKLEDEGLIDNLVLLPTNYGLENARNRGLELVTGDYFVCVDNDCLPPPREDGKDWLERLYDLAQKYSHESIGAISLRTQVMIGTGNIFDGHEDNDIVPFPHPGGSYRLMQTKVIRRLGGWRDDMAGRGSEERYIGEKLNAAGYLTAFSVKIQCLHLFGIREKGTDRWGYPKHWEPARTGHSDIWHPALEQGDDYEEVKRYAGEPLAKEYFNADSHY